MQALTEAIGIEIGAGLFNHEHVLAPMQIRYNLTTLSAANGWQLHCSAEDRSALLSFSGPDRVTRSQAAGSTVRQGAGDTVTFELGLKSGRRARARQWRART